MRIIKQIMGLSLLAFVLAFFALWVSKQFMTEETDQQTKDLVAVHGAGHKQWRELSSKDHNFCILLPGYPQHVTYSVPTPSEKGPIKYETYVTQEKEGTTFMLSIIEYPHPLTEGQKEGLLLEVQGEYQKGNVQNELAYSEQGLFDGFPSIDFLLSGKKISIRARGVVVGSKLYILTLIDHSIQDVEDHFRRYASTFQLKKEERMPR